MNEARLFQLAAKYYELTEQIEQLKAARARLGDKIADDMLRKDVKSIKGEEWQITVVTPEVVEYDAKKAERVLGKPLFAKISRRIVDKDALHYQLSQGNVTADQIGQFAIVKPRKPYIRVSPSGREED